LKVATPCREGDNTLKCSVIPLLFIPGVMGSRLRLAFDVNLPSWDWDPDSKRAMIGWYQISAEERRRNLHENNPGRVMTSGHELKAHEKNRGWEGISWQYYGAFLREMNDMFYARTRASVRCPVYGFGYDWRQHNAKSARKLAARIKEILKQETTAKRLILITHSMGGLVARWALRDEAVASKVVGVIHITQPVAGAPVLYRRFLTGARKGPDGKGVEGSVFTTVLGNTASKFATIMSGLSGPMQLLPTDAFDKLYGPESWMQVRHRKSAPAEGFDGHRSVFELYQRRESPPGLIDYAKSTTRRKVRKDVHDRLFSAFEFHQALGLHKHERTYSIYSTGVMTDCQTVCDLEARSREPNEPNKWVSMGRREEGDGTVPRLSAQMLFPGQSHPPESPISAPQSTSSDARFQIEVRGVEHAAACNDATVRKVTGRMVRALVRTALSGAGK